MLRLKLLSVFLTVVLIFALAPNRPVVADSTVAQDVDDFMRRASFMGSVLIAKDGEVLVNKGYGMASLEFGIPNTPQTKFRLWWSSMPITAALILRLQQDGKLNLQDSICKYLKDCPDKWKDITFHHMLSHTSGLWSEICQAWGACSEPFVNKDSARMDFQLPAGIFTVIDWIKKREMNFAPGTKWQFSAFNYWLLAQVFPDSMGGSYSLLAQKYIFDPLEMKDSGHNSPTAVIPNHATGYEVQGTPRRAEYTQAVVGSDPEAGLYSTTEDLYRFLQALESDTFLNKELRTLMFSKRNVVPSNISLKTFQAYGWTVQENPTVGGDVYQASTSLFFGYSSGMLRVPGKNLTVIMLSNGQNVENFLQPMLSLLSRSI